MSDLRATLQGKLSGLQKSYPFGMDNTHELAEMYAQDARCEFALGGQVCPARLSRISGDIARVIIRLAADATLNPDGSTPAKTCAPQAVYYVDFEFAVETVTPMIDGMTLFTTAPEHAQVLNPNWRYLLQAKEVSNA